MTEAERTAPRGRTCVGCGASDVRDAFVRLVLVPSSSSGTEGPSDADSRTNSAVVDVAGGAFGRGAHVHPRMDCLERACRSGLARSWKTKVSADPAVLAAQVVAGAERRIAGLIIAARRKRSVAVGADATCEAADRGARALVIAADAGSVVGKTSIQRALAEGRVVVWGDKDRLGALLGEATVAVSAITSADIADSILAANALIQSLGSPAGGKGRA